MWAGNGPLVVHCRNGCGETGTFIALDQISQHIQNKSLTSVLEIVRQLRQDRPCMVENYKQYLLLYKSVKHVSDNPYDIVINDNRDENEGESITSLVLDLSILLCLCEIVLSISCICQAVSE
ncbi:receptor-type tyrosine-protein phosphatase epsilon-like [Clavelina lepadiformis]|uniref:receptor-type tyrosine-protein phosphatase epsilon-like n=1 Tax=Clavelina lepadiformis TaxID=159417 RepID=UPI0040421658